MSIRLTVIQSSSDVPLDRLAGWWSGVETVLVRADLGEPIPAASEVADALVVLGGHMSAYDDEGAAWLPALRTLLADAARSGVPTLGICLGAQLLAVATGGRVQVAAPPGPEAGVVNVFWRPEALDDAFVGPFVANLPERRVTAVPTLHSDAVVDLPPGAVWLASSNQYPYQAFRVGSAWGLQFHPEASTTTMRDWARWDGTVDTDAILADYAAREDELVETGAALAAGFLTVVREHAARRVEA
ncbi:type 1 glutamine amidotransferase [Cellulomonas composti]|uniref:type 1 glutamine amidotransferase n=1 Tax=Cellulomonas composti TaxID=266130 RepID=UPI001FE98625|nr:type 1 glutamine amidotransferase [Cellulomonas composti]